MKLIIILLALNAYFLKICCAYRILGVFPMNTKSHFIVFESVMKALANHGHQVDVVSHFPQNKAVNNYNDIISFKGLMESLVNNYTIDQATHVTNDVVKIMGENYGNRICGFMSNEKFQKLVKNPPTDPPYDLVITQTFAANCYMGLGYVFKVPVIAITSTPEFSWINRFIGNPDNLAIVTSPDSGVSGKMNFWQRLKNVYSNYMNIRKFHAYTEAQTASMRKYLSKDIPEIREVEKNVALLFVNTHLLITGVKPILPSIIPIAGLQIETNQEILSADLKKWMDESISGVVYFTLGSMILIESLPKTQLQEIYASFEKISPVRVLIKIANDSKLPPGLPNNVKTLPWIPQQPVLAHPNTKLFITHGGLGGSQEALYFGVPTIGIPFFTDQFRNTESLVEKGMSIKIEFEKLSQKTLDSALSELLTNPKFKKNAVRCSKIFREQPISQSDKVNFWVEYIIRNGANTMRSPAIEFSWCQLYLVDVFGFVFLVITLIVSVIILSVRLMIMRFSRKSSGKVAKKKKS